mgnify:CR=1 FL=1
MRDQTPTAEQWYFEDLETGESFDIPSKTITDTHFVLFSGMTGDYHPLHMDQHYTEEETALNRFRIVALGALVVLYFGFLVVYAVLAV